MMDNIQMNKLVSYCELDQMDLKCKLKNELIEQRGIERVQWHDGFLYSPGIHPVLLVAHLDTVHKTLPTAFYIDETKSKNGDLWCKEGIGGDDRCGIYIIMEIIKHLDCHVLCCEDEESGAIGAKLFCKSEIKPDVRFIVEFDRKGNNDAVFYSCENQEFTDFVTSFGFNEEWGTFSDISLIAPHLEIAAVNLSSGYYQQHTPSEYIRLDDVESIIERAIPLLSDVSKTYEYIEGDRCGWFGDWPGRGLGDSGWYSFSKFGDEGKKLWHFCDWCEISSNEIVDVGEYYLCRHCYNSQEGQNWLQEEFGKVDHFDDLLSISCPSNDATNDERLTDLRSIRAAIQQMEF
jgi:hypothetical protein